MFIVAHEYDISVTAKNLFDTAEEASKSALKDLAENPSNNRKRYVIEVIEILQNEIAVPPVKTLDVRSIKDQADKRSLLIEAD